MNFSSLIGLVLGVAMMYEALSKTSDNIMMFLDLHGIVIVLGGTFAAASISFPLLHVIGLTKVFFLRVLGKHKIDYQSTIAQLLELNKKASMGTTGLNDSLGGIKHAFLKEAVALVAAGVLTETEIRNTLDQRVRTIETSLMSDANMFRAIGRFPPAFGLLATTLGMIALLQKIGQPGSEKLIGPAMSIGLIGTLYGIGLANLFFNPIAENLTERTNEEVALHKMIVEGAIMLKQQCNPISMREGLNSFLLPKQRVTRKAA